MSKLTLIALIIFLTGCASNIPKETECIAKPPLPAIQLDRLVFPKTSGKLFLNVEDQLVCLPVDDFLQSIDNNKQVSAYIQRCNLIKETYETYYGVELNQEKPLHK